MTLRPSVPLAGRAYRQALRHLFDPRIALASLVALAAGMALAYADGHSIDPAITLAAFAAIVCVEIGRSAIGQIAAGKASASGDSFTGTALKNIAVVNLTLAAVIGTLIANATQAVLFAIGAVAVALAAAYFMKPFRLSSRGLGELAAGLVYGPCMVLGSVLMFGGQVTPTALTISAVLGLLLANVVLVGGLAPGGPGQNRTLAIRLGRIWTERLFSGVFATAFSISLIGSLAIASVSPLGLLLGVIPADFAVWSLRANEDDSPARARVGAMIAYVGAAAGAILFLIGIASLS